MGQQQQSPAARPPAASRVGAGAPEWVVGASCGRPSTSPTALGGDFPLRDTLAPTSRQVATAKETFAAHGLRAV
ncbi:hypothetical protein [Streptomyces flavofungini]|uniref:Uncharacterized protein n=1 Tax=Streptomyces flavofungini TaxID=68200 RepID=A0ABS0X0E0_9ACTN|nr:hypothetical protein [Streptomyces flavofungini]MBJ3806635.1 hypothetical protein [Streptomyces flavofungini]GHC61597.1 hypothetical protein GCM10010349_31540 [Streptomyces flavofungini]